MQESGKKKILIIEDEKPLSHALALKLSHEGFDVVATESGAQGLEYLDKQVFDLVLTDLIIPGVDGFKILETMKEKNITTPVIVITNLNQEEDKSRVFALGASAFFVKSNSTISEIVANAKNKISGTSAQSANLTPTSPPIPAPIQPENMVDVSSPVQQQSQLQAQPQVVPTLQVSTPENISAQPIPAVTQPSTITTPVASS